MKRAKLGLLIIIFVGLFLVYISREQWMYLLSSIVLKPPRPIPPITVAPKKRVAPSPAPPPQLVVPTMTPTLLQGRWRVQREGRKSVSVSTWEIIPRGHTLSIVEINKTVSNPLIVSNLVLSPNFFQFYTTSNQGVITQYYFPSPFIDYDHVRYLGGFFNNMQDEGEVTLTRER